MINWIQLTTTEGVKVAFHRDRVEQVIEDPDGKHIAFYLDSKEVYVVERTLMDFMRGVSQQWSEEFRGKHPEPWMHQAGKAIDALKAAGDLIAKNQAKERPLKERFQELALDVWNEVEGRGENPGKINVWANGPKGERDLHITIEPVVKQAKL